MPETAMPTVEQDLPCAACGYNLRTLASDGTCPECGRGVEATLAMARSPLARQMSVTRLRRGTALWLIGVALWVAGLTCWASLWGVRYALTANLQAVLLALQPPWISTGTLWLPEIVGAGRGGRAQALMYALLLMAGLVRAAGVVLIGWAHAPGRWLPRAIGIATAACFLVGVALHVLPPRLLLVVLPGYPPTYGDVRTICDGVIEIAIAIELITLATFVRMRAAAVMALLARLTALAYIAKSLIGSTHHDLWWFINGSASLGGVLSLAIVVRLYVETRRLRFAPPKGAR